MNNLAKIEHFVVLMQENRSFDHMLGYLSLQGRTDINGINPDVPLLYDRNEYRPEKLRKTWFSPDPGHSSEDVEQQLNNDGLNNGFMANYAIANANHPEAIIGYYDADALPVYDHLASTYAVCNSWFASLPGPTWPNRLFAICGVEDDKRPDGMETIFDYLGAHEWRYFYHQFPPFLLAAFAKDSFRGTDPNEAFERLRLYRSKTAPMAEFYEMARDGTLPAVAWIEPNFADVPLTGNDDHPPVDVRFGQQLVADVYNALIENQEHWKKTALLITYDEHGGFYDHVRPPSAPENPTATYGVRLPAIMVSAWTKQFATPMHDAGFLFDHTSIVRTIATRFCDQMPPLGERLPYANDLGCLLNSEEPRRVAERITRPSVNFYDTLMSSLLILKKRLGSFRSVDIDLSAQDADAALSQLAHLANATQTERGSTATVPTDILQGFMRELVVASPDLSSAVLLDRVQADEVDRLSEDVAEPTLAGDEILEFTQETTFQAELQASKRWLADHDIVP